MSSTRRVRNRRGEGGKLRDEIIAAASELLDEANGDEAALTLRAIARRAGITAPSIYAHFDDREAILRAVLVDVFTDLAGAMRAASDGGQDPVARLYAGCRACLDFAAAQPGRYRILFQRRPAPGAPPLRQRQSLENIAGAHAFNWLVDAIQDCVNAGRSTTPSALDSAIHISVALHGFATMRASDSGFPWPDTDTMLHALIDRLGHISAPPPDHAQHVSRAEPPPAR